MVGILLAGAVAAYGAGPLPILRNGGFEEDEMSFRGEPASSCGGASNDQWFDMQDRFPEIWIWPGKCAPNGYGMASQSEWPLDDVMMDPTAPHSGKFALRLKGKAVSINQTMHWNSLTDIYGDVAKGADHTASFLVRDGLCKDLVLEGWVKCQDVPANASGSVSIALSGAATPVFNVPKGTVEWTKFQIALPATEQVKALKQTNPGGTLAVTLNYASPDGTGQVWFDDFSLTVAERTEPNLLPDPSFEKVGDGAKAPPGTGRGSNASGAKMPPAGDALSRRLVGADEMGLSAAAILLCLEQLAAFLQSLPRLSASGQSGRAQRRPFSATRSSAWRRVLAGVSDDDVESD